MHLATLYVGTDWFGTPFVVSAGIGCVLGLLLSPPFPLSQERRRIILIAAPLLMFSLQFAVAPTTRLLIGQEIAGAIVCNAFGLLFAIDNTRFKQSFHPLYGWFFVLLCGVWIVANYVGWWELYLGRHYTDFPYSIAAVILFLTFVLRRMGKSMVEVSRSMKRSPRTRWYHRLLDSKPS